MRNLKYNVYAGIAAMTLAMIASHHAPVNVNAEQTIHMVQPGEYLRKIAEKYNVTIDQLKEWNQLSSDLIHPNTTLIVAKSESEPIVEKTETTTTVTETTTVTTVTETTTITESVNSTYTVKPGDYLWKLANRFNVTVDQLRQWNQLKSDNLYVGQPLVVKGVSSTNATQPAPTPVVKPVTPVANTYTVKAGDYLWKIANQHKVTVNQLREWNQLKSDFLQIGQQLIIKEGQAVKPTIDPTPSKPTQNNFYVVKAGDSLWKVANQHKVTVSKLKEWNQLTSDFLQIGQKLVINAPSVKVEQPTTKPVTPTTGNTYSVKSGDYLWKIANQHKVTVQQLKEWNQLTSDFLQIGQKLVINAPSVKVEQPTTKPVTPTTGSTYVIKAGDNLWRIARNHQVSLTDLRAWNQLKTDLLSVGQTLVIKTPAAQKAQANTYTVKAGDNLWNIARAHHTTVEQLRTINQLNSSLLQIGQVLKLK